MTPITGLLSIGSSLIDKLLPDPEAKARAQLELAKLAQDGELRDLEVRMSAILAEAKSADPWTSRARPSFMYVMYAMILASVPMGVLYAINPTLAGNITTGMEDWLAAIPEEMWWLFGAGYLGYTTARSADKRGRLKRG